MRKELLNKANLAWLLLSVVSFVVLTILMKVGIIGSYYSITLYNIFINIILAVSLNLVIGVCGQFSLGHAGFMCIGAYCAGIMVKMMPNMSGLAIGVLIGFALSTIVALIVSIPTLRLKGDYLAIAMFLLFGTLKSLSQFKDSHTIYTLFHTVPYTLLGLSIPLSCYVAFILYRYRLSQPSMLALCIGMGFLLFAISSYVALAAWIGVAFMFRANLNRFFTYLDETNHA